MAKLQYQETYRLRESDMDYSDNVRASALLDFFQSVAGKHANLLGVGFDDAIKRDIIWVVTKLKCDCLLPLKFDERITVETCPLPRGILDYTRDYYIYNENGELAVKATSQWVLLNFRTRRIEKPILDFDGEFTDKRAYPEKRIEKVAPFSAPAIHTHTIVRSDLDHNGHTNNVRYADMCFDAAKLPEKQFKRLTINFISESRLNDTIDISMQSDGNTFTFCGSKSGGETRFTARIEY